jgi:hypothetical protein
MNAIVPEPEKHSPLDLQLDPYNPRLSAEEEGGSPAALLQIILERFKLEELAQSFIASGYLPFDPLIGRRSGDTVTILEGNRRIAALKLLLDPTLAPEKYRRKWEALSAAVPEDKKDGFREVEVSVFPSGEDVDVESYIGFRHVTGVLQWPALEKASYISRLVHLGWDYKTIAERLGSYPKTVEKHYVGYRIVEQARSLEVPGWDRLAGSFGVLMRALQVPGVLNFLGVTFPGDPHLSAAPIPDEKQDNFKSFIEWTFGTSEKPRLIQDSRQLTRWGKILASTEAVSYLRRATQPSFDRAWFRSGGESESLVESLLQAADYLEQSIPLIPLHKEEQPIVATVERCTAFILQILRDFPDLRDKYGVRVV